MKIKPISILFLSFFLCIPSLTTQEEVISSNKQIVLGFIKELADSLSIYPTNRYLHLKISTHSLSEFVESIIIERLSAKEFKFFTFQCDSCTNIQLTIRKFDINYKRIIKEKPTNFIIRKVELEVVSLIKEPNSDIKPLLFVETYNDTINFENFDIVEKDGIPFTGKKPKEPENFLKKYIEPIVIIGSTALGVLLFFTIRSK
ncbi:MAG: hypothetical protein N2560_03830 [Ignavibacteria bacterium]|nr:hypothetical protein [Ignavibacteria bacterium]